MNRVQSCHNLLLQQLMIQRETVTPRLPHSGIMTESLQPHYKGLRRKYERRRENAANVRWLNKRLAMSGVRMRVTQKKCSLM